MWEHIQRFLRDTSCLSTRLILFMKGPPNHKAYANRFFCHPPHTKVRLVISTTIDDPFLRISRAKGGAQVSNIAISTHIPCGHRQQDLTCTCVVVDQLSRPARVSRRLKEAGVGARRMLPSNSICTPPVTSIKFDR